MASKIETTLRATLAALDAGDPDKAARLLRAALEAPSSKRGTLTDEEFLAPARAFHAARNAAIAAARADTPGYDPARYLSGVLVEGTEENGWESSIAPRPAPDYKIVRARTRAEWHNVIDYRGQRHKGKAVDWYAVPEARYWPGGRYPDGLEVHPVKSEAETFAWLRDELARCEAEAAKPDEPYEAPYRSSRARLTDGNAPVAQAVWQRRVASLRAELSAVTGA